MKTEAGDVDAKQREIWAAERERTIAASIASTMEALYPKATAIDGALFRLLLSCAHRVGIEVSARVAVGESVMGLLVLQLLAGPRPPVLTRELAGALGCTRSAITQTLTRLERRGLVARTGNTWDARTKTIALTDEARRVWNTAHAPVCAVMRKATASFAKGDKERLVELLERLERDVDHARVMRAWSGAEPERLETSRVPETPGAETQDEEEARALPERARPAGVHVR